MKSENENIIASLLASLLLILRTEYVFMVVTSSIAVILSIIHLILNTTDIEMKFTSNPDIPE